MKRSKVNPRVDKAVFTRTAVAGKKVNISVRPMRGGIRF